MQACTHTISDVNEDATKPLSEVDEDVTKPMSKLNIENYDIESEDKDYEYLILNPKHFKIGTLSKGKGI